MVIVLGIGFPASIQKFQEERYLDAVRAGSKGIEATSPPRARFPLLNHRSVTMMETTRSKTPSIARGCRETRFIKDLILAFSHTLT